jgi:cardiolipin synthase
LDPIADKLLIISAFISLAILRIIPGWLTVIVISRDILILLGVSICTFTNIKVQIKPSFVSKCTTVAQLLIIFLSMYHHIQTNAFFQKNAPLLYSIAAVLTIISGLHYGYNGMRLMQEALKVNGYEK